MSTQYISADFATHIKDGRIYLALPFTHSNSLKRLHVIHQHMRELSLVEINAGLNIGLTDKQTAKINDQYRPAWTEHPFTLDKQYFHDYVQQIFGNTEIARGHKHNKYTSAIDFIKDYIGVTHATHDPSSAGISHSLAPLQLTSEAQNLISGRYGTKGDGLCVQLSPAAVTRLQRAGYEPAAVDIHGKSLHYLRFDIEDANCLFFGTGVGMLVLQIHFMPRLPKDCNVPVDFILELNNTLCRANFWERAQPCHWFQDVKALQHKDVSDASSVQCGDQINCMRGLGHLAALLIGEQPLTLDSKPASVRCIHWEKAPTFCAVKTTTFKDRNTLELTGIRLARKETSDYRPCPESFIDAIYKPFTYLTHVASIEGGAMLVEITDDNPPHYVDTFVNNSSRRAYLPLMLWALHEFLFLTELSKSTGGWIDFHNPREEHTLRLQVFRERIYNYRFHFRFAQASVITMHNDMFRLWRKTFELGKILDEIDKDVAEAESKLDHIYSERSRQRQNNNRKVLASLVPLTGAIISIPDWQDKTTNSLLPFCKTDSAFYCNDVSLHLIILAIGSLSLAFLLAFIGSQCILELRRRLHFRKVKNDIQSLDFKHTSGD